MRKPRFEELAIKGKNILGLPEDQVRNTDGTNYTRKQKKDLMSIVIE